MAEQSRQNNLAIQGGVFEPGEQIEVNVNGRWVQGRIQEIESFTVRNTGTGRNVNRPPAEIRPENGSSDATGENTNIIPGDRVTFQGSRPIYRYPGILVSKNYIVQIDNRTVTAPHTTLRRPHQQYNEPHSPEEPPPPPIQRPRLPEPEYEETQEVEALVNGVWRPGQIGGIENYTVSETGRQHNVEPENIRGQYRLGTRQRTNLRVHSQVEIRQGNRWLPGTITAINYWVNMVDNIGGLETVSQSSLRPRRAPQPPQPVNPERAAWRAHVAAWRAELARPARPPQAAPLRQGLAWEVHNAFADLDLPKFMTIIRRENNGASEFKNTENILRPLFQYISSSDTNLSSEQKTRYKTNFRKPGGIIENVEQFISDHPEVITDTQEVIQFVLSQDPSYKDLYIETFENECMGGYSTGDRQSCTKGMFERIYMANKGTIEGLCFEELQSGNTNSAASASYYSSCKPVYLELYSAFTPGADIDINDIFQKWYNEFSYDAVPEEENILKNLSVEARKEHYRDFVRQDEAISERIWNNRDFQRKLEESIQKNNIIFETLTLDVGLGRKRRNRRTEKNKKKQRKTMKKQRKETMKYLKRSIIKRKTKGKY